MSTAVMTSTNPVGRPVSSAVGSAVGSAGGRAVVARPAARRPPSTGRASSGTARPRLRVTRRGRLTVLATLVAGFTALGVVLGLGSGSATTDGAAAGSVVTVEPGDTLWSIAARVDPHQDPRLVVATLEAANRLAGPAVVPGQALRVPAGW